MKTDLLQIKRELDLNPKQYDGVARITVEQYNEIVDEMLFNRLNGLRVEISRFHGVDSNNVNVDPGFIFQTSLGELTVFCPELGKTEPMFEEIVDEHKWYEFWK